MVWWQDRDFAYHLSHDPAFIPAAHAHLQWEERDSPFTCYEVSIYSFRKSYTL